MIRKGSIFSEKEVISYRNKSLLIRDFKEFYILNYSMSSKQVDLIDKDKLKIFIDFLFDFHDKIVAKYKTTVSNQKIKEIVQLYDDPLMLCDPIFRSIYLTSELIPLLNFYQKNGKHSNKSQEIHQKFFISNFTEQITNQYNFQRKNFQERKVHLEWIFSKLFEKKEHNMISLLEETFSEIQNLLGEIAKLKQKLKDEEKIIEDLKYKFRTREDFSFESGKKPIETDKIKNNKTNKGLIGLFNTGNSCYFNSVLQCLSNTETISSFFCRDQYTHISDIFSNLMKQIWSPFTSNTFVNPSDLKKFIGENLNSKFSSYHQEDAHELLLCLLNGLEQDLLNQRLEINQKAAKNVIGENMVLTMKNTVQCKNYQEKKCYYNEKLQDSFFLSISFLELPSTKFTLNNSLKQIFTSDEYPRTCQKCQENTTVIKSSKISKAPNVLIFHLQRFSSFTGKLSFLLEFPIENLDISEYVENKGHFVYDLYAVCNHMGASHKSGHYYTYAKNKLNRQWYCFNDSEVTKLRCKDLIISSNAYLLFYEKKFQ